MLFLDSMCSMKRVPPRIEAVRGRGDAHRQGGGPEPSVTIFTVSGTLRGDPEPLAASAEADSFGGDP